MGAVTGPHEVNEERFVNVIKSVMFRTMRKDQRSLEKKYQGAGSTILHLRHELQKFGKRTVAWLRDGRKCEG